MPKVRCVCKKQFSFKPEHAGKVVACPVCKAKIRLPKDEPALEIEQPAQPEAAPPKEPKLELDMGLPPGISAPSGAYALEKPVPPPQPKPREPMTATDSPPADIAAASENAHDFWKRVPKAFVYPFSADGIAALVIAFILFVAAHYVIRVSVKVAIVGELVQRLTYLTLAGSLTSYLMTIMKSSAEGDDTAPSWPNVMEFRDNVFMPFLFVVFPFIFTVGPAIAYYYLAKTRNDGILMGILAAGLVYLPISMLPIALKNDFHRLNPVPVLRALGIVREKYAPVWGMATLAGATWLFGARLLKMVVPLPVAVVIQQAVFLYLTFIAARLIGLLYSTSKDGLKIPVE